MARLLIGAALGVAIGVVVGAALDISAQSEETIALATEHNLDPTDLQAAADTVGVGPARYLATTFPHAAPPPPIPIAGVWARLAACEATSNWRANTGNGYFGGLQQDMTFWRRYGGLAFAPRPDLATPAQQVTIAERGLAVQGWGAWPVCSRRIGVR